METEEYKKQVHTLIRKRLIDLQAQGHKTIKGHPISFAAIARTLEPEVSRAMVSQVALGHKDTPRIREAIERQLGELYWIKTRSAA